MNGLKSQNFNNQKAAELGVQSINVAGTAGNVNLVSGTDSVADSQDLIVSPISVSWYLGCANTWRLVNMKQHQ
jgi:hypothetical protein